LAPSSAAMSAPISAVDCPPHCFGHWLWL